MKTEQCAELTGNGKQQPVFEGLQVQAELLETLSITTITQTYRNPGRKNIEAVYTFPLPLDAVLLEMTVTLGDKTLKGTVLPKQEAEEQYEEAITDGDAPVMLQNPQPGLYTMNVGNLQPGEQATITIRYGMFQNWQGETLRYHLPTTIAPRYGSAELEPHQEPETSIAVDNLCTFTMKIYGSLASLAIESPSHEISVERSDDGKQSSISLNSKSAFMDRDLIVVVRKGVGEASSAVTIQDGEEYLVWASFQPHINLAEDLTPRSIKIVVDCSGSMAGDSITQAQEALLRILDELRPQDWFNIIVFGNTTTPLFNAQVQADREALAYARGFLQKLDADMGGTEIGKAIDMALGLRCAQEIEQNVLLITDGEIWNWERIVAKAQKSSHRFFTVGVGSSVSEAFVRELAEGTGGACELVSPNEQMAERIHRQFKRIGTPGTQAAKNIWPLQPQRSFPEQMPKVYEGDTCNLFAWFSEMPIGEATLQLSLPDRTEHTQSAVITANTEVEHDLPRMAAALRLRGFSDEKSGQELAVKYQLVSKWTNYLAIGQREDVEKAETLPELHKVQQMLAAGWGGTGSVMYCSAQPAASTSFDIPCFLRKVAPAAAPKTSDIVKEMENSYGQYRSSEPVWIWDIVDHDDMEKFTTLIDQVLSAGTMPTTINFPLLPERVAELLNSLREYGFNEQAIVIIFLHHLAESQTGGNWLSHQSKRIIQKAYKKLQADTAVFEAVKNRLICKRAKQNDSIVSALKKRLFGNDSRVHM
jgi:Ca-activated chloride channel family protein